MSIRFSPDGMYYWDGARWVTTISHDGRFRWDGARWVPLQASAAIFGAVSAPSRQPTSWTRPLQLAVGAWYALQAIYALTLPFWLGGMMSQVMTQAMQRQEQLYPPATPLPPGFNDQVNSMMSSLMTLGFGLGAILGIAISALAIIGAFNRWSWVYYAVLALLGLGTLSLPINIISLFTGPVFSSFAGVSLPTWFYALSVLIGTLNTALFIWMLVALVKRGPWGMTKTSPA